MTTPEPAKVRNKVMDTERYIEDVEDENRIIVILRRLRLQELHHYKPESGVGGSINHGELATMVRVLNRLIKP